MSYINQLQLDAAERAYLEPPEPEDPDDYDRRWDMLADTLYEQMREEEILCR